ncbi:MAG: hypothetical protein AAB495_01610 [Patescibacteria group bacterium]
MKIKKLSSRAIFDSRGERTIEVELTNSRGETFRASTPSGKSTGSNEATVFSARKGVFSVNRIGLALCGKSFFSLSDLDAALLSLDGTKSKSRLGGNVMLSVSIAALRAMGSEKRIATWQALRKEFFKGVSEKKRPHVFSNVINGGAHGRNNLSIQEYMIVARPESSYENAISSLIVAYQKIGELLARRGFPSGVPIGDEGGYSVQFKNNFEPIQILERVLRETKMSRWCGIAIDAAATGFYKKEKYHIDGKFLSEEALSALYCRYRGRSKLLFSIEDPFWEKDSFSFAALRRLDPSLWVVGDDLTTTNPASIDTAGKEGLINAVIIKPNQIGTVTEACWAMNAARRLGIKTIVSHRSGETEDAFIIHLAKAGGADGVKIGAPTRERMVKFNELMRIF